MSKKNIVIVSHSLDETITRCIRDNIKNFEVNIKIISLQELMSDYTIFDEVSDRGTCINWSKGLDHPISNSNHFLLNRVLYVPDRLFINFAKIDREYAQRELEAYIGFSFNAFTGIGNQLANGACVVSISLPQQWHRIVKELGINVPNYYWGPYIYNNLANKDTLVYSRIYNFLNWSITLNPKKENHIFCFEKPPGQPVFILSIGNKQLITSDIILSSEVKNRLEILVGRLNKFFNHFVSEILIFVNGLELNFGCINPEVIRSNKNKNFDDFVCNNLISEFYKCMN